MSKTFDLVDLRDLVINTTYLVLYCGLGNRPVSFLESHLKNRKQKCATTKSGQGKELGIMESRIEDLLLGPCCYSSSDMFNLFGQINLVQLQQGL